MPKKTSIQAVDYTPETPSSAPELGTQSGTHRHGHTSMPAGVTCNHCGHDSSHHVQHTGTEDDKDDHPCWFGIAEPDECECCPGFEARQ